MEADPNVVIDNLLDQIKELSRENAFLKAFLARDTRASE